MSLAILKLHILFSVSYFRLATIEIFCIFAVLVHGQVHRSWSVQKNVAFVIKNQHDWYLFGSVSRAETQSG